MRDDPGGRPKPKLFSTVVGALVTASLCLSSHSLAQAWTPPQGEASLSLSYGNVFINSHYFAQGQQFDLGHIRGASTFLDLGYGITDRLAIDAGIPFVSTKYYGSKPHKPIGTVPAPADWEPLDDGLYHGFFQDYRIDLRYKALSGPLVLTPFADAIIPSHDYVYFAHSAAGRDLHEYILGFNVGGRLERILPNAYAQARYGYAFVERVLGVRHDRSNVDLEIGYFLTPSVGVRALGSWDHTHGGLDFPLPGTPEFVAFQNSIYWPHHDQLSRESHLNLGGGLSYTLTGSVDVYASYITTVWGRNGHKIANGFNFGVAWGFSPLQLVRRVFAPGSQRSLPESP